MIGKKSEGSIRKNVDFSNKNRKLRRYLTFILYIFFMKSRLLTHTIGTPTETEEKSTAWVLPVSAQKAQQLRQQNPDPNVPLHHCATDIGYEVSSSGEKTGKCFQVVAIGDSVGRMEVEKFGLQQVSILIRQVPRKVGKILSYVTEYAILKQ